MHLNVFHHASWHVVHHVKQNIIYYVWCTRVRRFVLIKFRRRCIHRGVGAKSNFWIFSVNSNLLCNASKPQSINLSLVFTNLYYTLSLVRCALSD
jgi:hypothetical protein